MESVRLAVDLVEKCRIILREVWLYLLGFFYNWTQRRRGDKGREVERGLRGGDRRREEERKGRGVGGGEKSKGCEVAVVS